MPKEHKFMDMKTLAAAIGADSDMVYRWEHGLRNPAKYRIEQIAKATGVTIGFLNGEYPIHHLGGWWPMYVMRTPEGTAKTFETAKALIEEATGEPLIAEDMVDEYEDENEYLQYMFDGGWLTWESGALVQWMDGQEDEQGILYYVMYVE